MKTPDFFRLPRPDELRDRSSRAKVSAPQPRCFAYDPLQVRGSIGDRFILILQRGSGFIGHLHGEVVKGDDTRLLHLQDMSNGEIHHFDMLDFYEWDCPQFFIKDSLQRRRKYMRP